jgi:hypothetical protein
MRYQKSIHLGAVMAALAMTACGDSPLADLLPGQSLDQVGPQSLDSQPCGYETTSEITASGMVFTFHDTFRIAYNDAGLNVLEEGFDESGQLQTRERSEYSAMGKIVYHAIGIDPFLAESFIVYDSFGRSIRSSFDLDGDGTEEVVRTHTNDGEGRRIATRVVDLRSTNYDLTYQYDDNARVIQTDRDNGPDGTIDEVTTIEYDDVARVMTRTVTDAANGVIDLATFRYDERNRIRSWNMTMVIDGDNHTATHDYVYDSDRLVAENDQFTRTDPSGTPISSSTTRYDWQYGSCQ